MSVPPAGQPPSTPPSGGKGRPDEDKRGKEFNLPGRKKPVEKDDEKKKGLFDLPGGEAAREMKQFIGQEQKAETLKTEQISATEAKIQVTQIAKLIQKMVADMRIGEAGGTNFASLNLKEGAEVPQAFAGSNLTLSLEAGGLKIHFDMTPQQIEAAVVLVEKNKEQLQQLVQALQAKNIQVSELSIGSHLIALPPVQAITPPSPAAPQAETREQQQQREREGGEGGEGPTE